MKISSASFLPAKNMSETKRLDLEKISLKVGLKPSELRKVLWILYRKKAIGNNELIREAGLPKSVMRDLKRALRPVLKGPSRLVALTKEGEKFIEEEILSPLLEQPLSLPEGETLKKLSLNKLKSFQAKRPLPKRSLDQLSATPETVLKRGLLIQDNGDLDRKSILVLGDYDLSSLGLALIGGAKRILVVDIDRRTIKLIKEISQKEGLRVDCLYYDARGQLPKNLRNSFDVVFSDPPYTPNGLRLFLSRAVEATRNNGVLYFCYGYSRRSLERGLEAQMIFTQAGLLIESKYEDFNVYLGAESIGSRSSFYYLKATPKTKALVKEHFRGPIYTGRKLRQ